MAQSTQGQEDLPVTRKRLRETINDKRGAICCGFRLFGLANLIVFPSAPPVQSTALRNSSKRPASRDVWYLDEVAVRINGKRCWLWRAVDQRGYVLDEIVQNRRNTKAARRLLMRLLKKQDMAPKRIITDKLRSYGAAKRQIMPEVKHRSHKGLNNRAENSHFPFRKREYMRQGFRSIGGLQHFVSTFSAIRNLLVPDHTKPSATQVRDHRKQAVVQWKAISDQLA